MPSETTWQDVGATVVRRWPAGPGNRGWEREQLAGYVAEMEVDRLTPERAIIGLRACDSDFVPSVGRVRSLARQAQGPPSAAAIAAAMKRHEVAAAPVRHLNAA